MKKIFGYIGLGIFLIYPAVCFLVDQVKWDPSSSNRMSFDFKHHKKNVYERWFNPIHGLELRPDINKLGERFNENGILFYVEWLILLEEFGQLEKKDKAKFQELVFELQSHHKGKKVKGIYDRGGNESLKKEKPDLNSHDNITAVVAGSNLFNLNYSKEVADYGIKNLMNFDNQNVNKIGLNNFQLHPRDWFFWLRSSGNYFHRYLSYFSFPVFFLGGLEDPLNHIKCRPVWWEKMINQFRGVKLRNESCFLDTSGPLLWYVRYNSLKRKSGLVNLMRKFFGGLYEIHYGQKWKIRLFKIYFNHPKHPNNILAKLDSKRSNQD
jgi:hypothetical protein